MSMVVCALEVFLGLAAFRLPSFSRSSVCTDLCPWNTRMKSQKILREKPLPTESIRKSVFLVLPMKEETN